MGFFKNYTRRWWQERFITLMVIPERTNRVHKVVVPFFLFRVALVLVSLVSILLLVVGFDYINVLGRMGENKRLKGENFRLRQEMQVIKNKIESMEDTIERVRNYAKKLQVLTGQGGKASAELPQGTLEELPPQRSSRLNNEPARDPSYLNNSFNYERRSLEMRMENLQRASWTTEGDLDDLQRYLLVQSSIAAATPSLVPIVGWISSSFGYRRHPIHGNYRLHTGVDIVAEPGTPVRAPADGVIFFSGHHEGYGKVLVIDHGFGIRSLFAHNSKLFVNPGDRVKRGQILSFVGSTGQSTGPHLHYEIRKNGVPVNPMTFFSRARF
ncbi:MAG: M23 family metallopeptidase [Deltaproteobacteria bacterium]|nr:M23 family metallopeptidase [Deltaproteobacteria bacterium]MBI3293698.1 M23 family metallopeptidase [Deltaproteobacteria bacterium]